MEKAYEAVLDSETRIMLYREWTPDIVTEYVWRDGEKVILGRFPNPLGIVPFVDMERNLPDALFGDAGPMKSQTDEEGG